MKHSLLDKIEKQQISKTVPTFREGDTLDVLVRIREGGKERSQLFKGTVIARDGGTGPKATFTLRRVTHGVGVERVFPLHSPALESIKVIRRGRVRRAKLYYIRNLTGKKARIAERTDINVDGSKKG